MIEACKILFLKRILHRWIFIKIKNWHNFIRIIHNLHVTFFTEEQNKFLWFLRDNNQRWRTSTQNFVFLLNMFWLLLLCFVLIHFICCVNRFQANQSFSQFDIFCFLGSTQTSVIWLDLQTSLLTSVWNTGCRHNRIWWNKLLEIGRLFIHLIICF